MVIEDFSGYEQSDRHGTYGGNAGDKDGVFDPKTGDYLIIKYPKSTREMKGKDLPSYTTSPLSEYLGSHIYEILGYDVHKTELGWKNGKIVVSCKDFCPTRGALAEIRTLKNAANKELSELIGEDMPHSSSGDMVSLDELMIHMEVNPLIKSVPGVKERFWNTVVVDIFINNNDRNNGNWGLLWDEKKKRYNLSPIFDNGNSFNNKWSEKKIAALLQDEELRHSDAIGGRTAYEMNGHIISAKKMLEIDDLYLKEAILRNAKKIKSKMPEIIDLIRSIPESYKGQEVCSEKRKELYIYGLETRFFELLQKREKEIIDENEKNVQPYSEGARSFLDDIYKEAYEKGSEIDIPHM